MLDQTSIFDFVEYNHPIQKYHYKKVFEDYDCIRIAEIFSGIGTFSLALKYKGAKYKTVGFSDIDKNAILAYHKIHGEDIINYGDIEKMDQLPDCDLCTWSFPCQDISLAGKQRGMVEGTRSNYGYVFLGVLERTRRKPKVLVMENVAQLMSEAFRKDYLKIFYWLSSMGYRSQTRILNAKNYGIPQNRDRVFIVSILGGGDYEWPIQMPLDRKIKDLLEDNVDKKYYLSKKQIDKIMNWNSQQNPIENAKSESDDCIQTITAKSNTSMNASMVLIKEPMIIDLKSSDKFRRKPNSELIPSLLTDTRLSVIEPICLNSKVNGKQPSVQDRIYDINGISTAITTGFMPSILIPEATKKGYAEAHDGDGVYINRPHQKRGVVQKGIIQTLKTNCDDVGVVIIDNEMKARIRKITPLEAWRFMGIKDEDFYKAKNAGISNSQLYKLAGNAIVVDVIEKILQGLI